MLTQIPPDSLKVLTGGSGPQCPIVGKSITTDQSCFTLMTVLILLVLWSFANQ